MLLAEPLLKKFSPYEGNVMRGLVACTGSQFCPQGVIETKHAAVEIGRLLEDELEIPELVSTHCKASSSTRTTPKKRSCVVSIHLPLSFVHLTQRPLTILRSSHEQVRIHWTGCPNSCGQVQCADIGLMGAKAKIPGVKGAVDGVDIYLGGQIGEVHILT